MRGKKERKGSCIAWVITQAAVDAAQVAADGTVFRCEEVTESRERGVRGRMLDISHNTHRMSPV